MGHGMPWRAVLCCALSCHVMLCPIVRVCQATFKYNPANQAVELVVDRDYQKGGEWGAGFWYWGSK